MFSSIKTGILFIIILVPLFLLVDFGGSKYNEIKVDKKTKEIVSYRIHSLNKFLKSNGRENQFYKFQKVEDGYVYFIDKSINKEYRLLRMEINDTFNNMSGFEIIDNVIYTERQAIKFMEKYGMVFYKQMKYNIVSYSVVDNLIKLQTMSKSNLKTSISRLINNLISTGTSQIKEYALKVNF